MKENNKKYSYFDLHCDTLTKLIEKKELLRSNKTAQVSLDRASEYLRYSQVFAVFCPAWYGFVGKLETFDCHSGRVFGRACFR